jgi:hypothetical protein
MKNIWLRRQRGAKAPSHITAEYFLEWHKPRRGNANPQVMTNDVWTWLIETGEWPFSAHEILGIKKNESPSWCFDRFGQSKTHLPDGSSLFIGGEHEDSYDEDFYIYNDVVIKRQDGSIEVLGYPIEVLPPTDFHSATLVGDKIFIIGRLGYEYQRKSERTDTYILDTKDFSIERLKSYGATPPGLHKHIAKLSDDQHAITCEQGLVLDPVSGHVVENTTSWCLSLASARWEQLSD